MDIVFQEFFGDIIMKASRHGDTHRFYLIEEFFVIGIAGGVVFLAYLKGPLQIAVAYADEPHIVEP